MAQLTADEKENQQEIEKNNSEIKGVFETGLKEIRACEFLDYILDYCGMVKGDAGVAQGVISCTMMDMLVSKNDCDSVFDYMKKRTKQYSLGLEIKNIYLQKMQFYFVFQMFQIVQQYIYMNMKCHG